MDIMNLAATLTLNTHGFESALRGAEGGMASLAKGIVSTQLLIQGVQAAFNGMKQIVSGGIDAYANYEQLVGGVETMFKSSAPKVQQYAKDAFRTAGLSANQYMETVTSFSASLMQGLKGDTDAAADLANQAVIDMSDNANKMGTDMQAIQNAYMGFAKGNFTMLDNLKLGYGGTKTEMIRLINDSGVLDKKIKNLDNVSFADMIKAIHKIQEEMGITGTTAEEAASTISGSKSSLYAAFQNLLTLTTDGTDQESIEMAQDAFVTSFATYFNTNLAPRITKGLNGSTEVISAIVAAIMNIDTESLTNIVSGAMNAGTGFLTSLTDITPWIFDQVSAIFTNPQITEDDSQKFGNALGNFVGTFVKNGVEHLPDVLSGLFTLGVNVADGFIKGLTAGLFGVGSETVTGEIKAIDDEMAESIKQANLQSTKANGLITFLEDLQTKYGDAAANMPEWKDAMQGLIDLSGDYYYFFDKETGKLNTSSQAMRDHTKAIRDMAIEEAKNRALGKKEQILYDLQTEKAVAEADIQSAQYTQQAIGQQYGDVLTEVFRQHGYTGEKDISLDMSIEELNEAIRQLNEHEGTQLYDSGIQYFTGLTGTDANGNPIVTSDTLVAIMKALSGDNSMIDITTPEQQEAIAGLTDEYEKQNGIIQQNKDRINELNGQIALAENAVKTARIAVDLWSESLSNSKPPVEKPNDSPSITYMPKATGIDLVPYDGFKAELHRNEAVLTSAEAAEWRKGNKGGNVDVNGLANVIASAVQAGMSRVGFYFDKEQVAAAVAPSVSENIADGIAAWGYTS